MTMSRDELLDYQNWVGESPLTIMKGVVAIGTWSDVFQTVPKWLSRIRNYFNVRPRTLKRMDKDFSKLIVQRRQKFTAKSFFSKTKAIEYFALNGDVYLDNEQRLWLMMGSGGGVYHYIEKPSNLQSVKDQFKGHKLVPIFKLVSHDPLGGSCEVCIHNWQLHNSKWDLILGTSGRNRLGKVGEQKDISTEVVIAPKFQGSYNFAETSSQGFQLHERMDIVPHSTSKGFYVDPPRSRKTLESRRFPQLAPDGTRLATDL